MEPVRKNKPLSFSVVKPGDVAEGDIIVIPLGTATLDATAPVTPEQSAHNCNYTLTN